MYYLFSKAEVILKVRAEFPQNISANTVVVQMPVPKYTSRYLSIIFRSPFFMISISDMFLNMMKRWILLYTPAITSSVSKFVVHTAWIKNKSICSLGKENSRFKLSSLS